MKKTFLSLIAMGALLVSVTACDSQEWNENVVPETTLEAQHIQTEAGYTINIKGKLTDANGIKKVTIWCPDLYMKKTIAVEEIYGEALKEYDLDYNFKIERYKKAEEYVVEVTTESVSGRTATQTLKVTLDGDYTAPQFVVEPSKETTVLMQEGQETVYELQFTVADNIGIDRVMVSINAYDLSTKEVGASIDNFPMIVDVYGEDTYEYSEGVIFPAEAGVYYLKVEAWDMPAQNGEVRTSTAEGLITVLGGVDFPKMYLADVATSEELNADVFGVPMRVDKVGECQYRARYFNEKANTEIYFIPQKGALSPICYGIDPTDPNKLINSPGNVLPLVLPEAGKYYEINFNSDSGEYEFHTYEVADYMDPIFFEYGAEVFNVWGAFVPGSDDEYLPADDAWLQPFYIGTGDNPTTVEPFVQDPNNKHLFMWADPHTLEAGDMNFMIHELHPAQWWNAIAWRVDDDVECDIFMYYGGMVKRSYLEWAFGPDCDWKSWNDSEDYRKKFVPDNWCHPVVKTPGQYMIYFDSHLGRAKLVPAK